MRHEDFTSLDLTTIFEKVMESVKTVANVTGVHWISAQGLSRVSKNTAAISEQVLVTEDMLSQHLRSQPALGLSDAYSMWKGVAELYPQPWSKALSPRLMLGATTRFIFPLYFEDHFLGVLALDNPKKQDLFSLSTKVAEAVNVAQKYIYFAYQYAQARGDSYIDEVTGLFNQRYLPAVLDHQIGLSKRDDKPFSLLFMDIDYFKKVNDSRGHMVGSQLLKLLADLIKSQVRSTDYCFRYGGDEFIVLLGQASAPNAFKVAERIRMAVAQRIFQVEQESIHLTVSIGLAAFPEHAESTSSLLQMADRAMYDGKQRSRNVVFVAS